MLCWYHFAHQINPQRHETPIDAYLAKHALFPSVPFLLRPNTSPSHLSVMTYSPATLALSILATVAGMSLFSLLRASTTPA